jgi:RNase P protein component
MQREPQFGTESSGPAEVYISIFPNVEEFFVLDVRGQLPGGPYARLMKVGDILDESLYKEVETRFSQMLRESDNFVALLRVSERIGYSIQRRFIRRILRRGLPEERLGEVPRVTIFIAAGDALEMTADALETGLRQVLGNGADSSFLSYCATTLRDLFEKERRAIAELERQRLRDVILGQSSQFLSLWESDEGKQSGPSNN